MLPTINAFWIGDKLGQIHAACLRSFQRHGHEVVLHCYDKPTDLPYGITIFDASKLMKNTDIIRHKETGSLALASDIYRYRILREGMGVYVDCDVYCINPIPNSEYILPKHGNFEINNCILRLPKDSAALREMLRITEDQHISPYWIKKRENKINRIKRLLGLPQHISKAPMGAFGPPLLTHVIRTLGIEHLASPIDVYSPVSWGQTELLFSEGLRLVELVTSRTITIHLYNSALPKIEIKPSMPIYEIIHS